MDGIGNVNFKINANAQGFVSEFKRADNEARRRVATMTASVDKLQKDIKTKFSSGQIGSSILSGLGLGTGFAVAQKAAEVIASYWQKAAESAQKIEASSTRAADAFEKRMALRRTPEQELALLEKGLKGIDSQLAKDDGILAQIAALPESRWWDADRRRSGLQATTLGSEKREELRAQREELLLKIEEKRIPIQAKLVEQAKAQTDAAVKTAESLDAAWKQQLITLMVEGEVTAEKEKQAAAAKKIADEATREANNKEFYDALIPLISEDAGSNRNEALVNDYQKFQEQVYDIFDSIGDRASATFADMILSGENAFAALADTISRSILEMITRLAIVNPLMNMLFGGAAGGGSLLPTLFSTFAGARAGGGSVSAGSAYLVGEKGMELFSPNTSGTIIPNNKLGMGGGGGVSNYYTIDARGASVDAVRELRMQMAALNSSIEVRAVAANRDADRRRK